MSREEDDEKISLSDLFNFNRNQTYAAYHVIVEDDEELEKVLDLQEEYNETPAGKKLIQLFAAKEDWVQKAFRNWKM